MEAENDTNYADIENVEKIIMVANVGPPAISDLSPNSDWKGTNNSSYGGCYGLPYQDHNYGAPLPSTPPLSPGKQHSNNRKKSVDALTKPPRKTNGEKKIGRPVGPGKRLGKRKERTNSQCNGDLSNDSKSKKPVDNNTTTVNTATSSSNNNATNPTVSANDTDPETSVDVAEIDDEGAGDYSDSVTRCICNFTHDDGYMICCDQCQVWQHIDCMGIDRENIPDEYSCEQCMPRKVSKLRARMIQKKRRDLIDKQQKQNQSEDENSLTVDQNSMDSNSPPPPDTDPKPKPTSINRNRKLSVRNSLDGNSNKKNCNSTIISNNQSTTSSRKRQSKGSTDTVFLSVDGDAEESPWTASYESAAFNQYSADVEEALKRYKSATHTERQLQSVLADLETPRCQLKLLVNGKRGLEVETALSSGVALIEFTGKVMLQQQFQQENDITKRPLPFVLFYNDWNQMDICVDATSFGNAARFVRRSCVPNSQVQHIIENGKLHLVLYTTKEIPPCTEVTIPFDFDFKASEYCVECACIRAQCPVRKAARKLMKSVAHAGGDNIKSEPKPAPIVATPKRESEEATLSSGEGSENAKGSHRKSTDSMKSPKAETCEEIKRMSREDRKIEAYMKAFEKMEKREERRKEALLRQHEKKEHQVTETHESAATSATASNNHAKPAVHKRGRHKSASSTSSSSKRCNMTGGLACTSQPVSEDDNSNSMPETMLAGLNHQPAPTTRVPPPNEVGSTSTGTVKSLNTFRAPKTKKDLLSEWYQEKGLNKPLTVKTTDLVTPPCSQVADDNIDFVITNHSPGSSFAHLRRNSMSTSHNTPVIPPKKLDTSMGSAKKRWLKQAMEEVDTVQSNMCSPVGSSQASPTGQSVANSNTAANSNNNANNNVTETPLSPLGHSSSNHCTSTDFVTPLKKRRLIRESLSMDDHPLSPDSSSASAAIPVITQDQIQMSDTSASLSSSFIPPPDEAANHATDVSTEQVEHEPASQTPAKEQINSSYKTPTFAESEVQTAGVKGTADVLPVTVADLVYHPPESLEDHVPLPVEEVMFDGISKETTCAPKETIQLESATTATTMNNDSLSIIESSDLTCSSSFSTVTPAVCAKRSLTDSDTSSEVNASNDNNLELSHNSSSPQKKKVSLQDYRNRLKVKAPVKPATPTITLITASTTPNNLSILSKTDELSGVANNHEKDSSVTLPVLPLFNDRHDVVAEEDVSQKPALSLNDRLAQVFGVSASPSETHNITSYQRRTPPPPPPPPGSETTHPFTNGLYPAHSVPNAAGHMTSPASNNLSDYPLSHQSQEHPLMLYNNSNSQIDLLNKSSPSYLLKQGSLGSALLGEPHTNSHNPALLMKELHSAKPSMDQVLPRKYQQMNDNNL